jgi:hypothetical protein
VRTGAVVFNALATIAFDEAKKNSMTLDPAGQWIETTDVIINNGPARRTVELRVRR